MFQPHGNHLVKMGIIFPKRGETIHLGSLVKLGDLKMLRDLKIVRMAFVKIKTSTAVLCFWTLGFIISFEQETRKPMERNSDKIII